MIFSELYSAYYNAVAGILSMAMEEETTEKDIQKQILEQAFSESVLSIMPALKEEKWQIIDRDFDTPLLHNPDMPLTTLQKQWLAAILEDPRMKLFGVEMSLPNVEPLFMPEDYKIFDQYGDGDPYEDEDYIERFRFLLRAIQEKRQVVLHVNNRRGKTMVVCFVPKRLEYSEKDDKFRLIPEGDKTAHYNLNRIISCKYYDGDKSLTNRTGHEKVREVVLHIEDQRNALERVMMHFAHFEKQAEKLDEKHYSVRIKYNESDETEMVIRVLSFGPFVKVAEPETFVNLIKERLISQKSCELK